MSLPDGFEYGACDRCWNNPDISYTFVRGNPFAEGKGAGVPQDTYNYYICDSCGVGFYSPRYRESDWMKRDAGAPEHANAVEKYGTWFPDDLKWSVEQQIRWTLQHYDKILQQAAAFAGPVEFVLDVGCHVGRQLEAARKRGWYAIGIEPNPYAARFARKRGTIKECIFQEADFTSDPCFDIVIMNDVLEHTFTPWKDLIKACSLARSGAVLYLKTFIEGYDKSSIYTGIGHEWHFSREVLLDWIVASGWSEILNEEMNIEWAQLAVWARKP